MVSALALSCQPEYPFPSRESLPSAENLDVSIVVNQETNYVTFTLNNSGMVPIWIFGEDKVADGKKSQKYAYTVNGLTLRVRDEGTHAVEVKAYNANGITIGSKIVEYTLENTYRDPFDPTPYMKTLAGEWVWNSSVQGHFGCGSSTANPTEWWSAGPEEKKDWSLYNDVMTFTDGGEYTFDPGEDGKVYVNKDFTELGTSTTGEDFLVDIAKYTTTYSIENRWNDAGIEEVWLVLPPKKNLSYIPNGVNYNDPRFLILSSSKKEVKFASDHSQAGISWMYNFVHPGPAQATPKELLAGTSAEGKAWVMDAAKQGHLGCGESADNPAGWWSAPPFDKKDFGMYDDVITFYPDGKYVYDSGEDGKMYINWGVTVIGPNPGHDPDIDIPQEDVVSKYVFDDEYITLDPNTPMVYVPSDAMWNNPYFKVTSLTETSMTVVAMNEGCYWQMIFKARDVEAPAQTIGGEPVKEAKVTLTLTQGETIEVTGMDLTTMWNDPDYFTAVDATHVKFNGISGDYEIFYMESWLKVIPLNINGEWATYDNGKALWIIGNSAGKPDDSHIIGWTTENALPLARLSDNTYRITLAVKADAGSFKIFGQAGWGKEFTNTEHTTLDLGPFHITTGGDSGGDPGNIYANSGVADGYYTLFVTDNDGVLTAKVEPYE